jgi:hypothetical protein
MKKRKKEESKANQSTFAINFIVDETSETSNKKKSEYSKQIMFSFICHWKDRVGRHFHNAIWEIKNITYI